jgi:two-component system response regulator GlrR
MIGRSSAFLAAVRRIERLAACDAPVVIEGETGTGKELAARAIHYGGRRRDKPFVPINCGALPEALIENELFGHQRGAFTDAAGAGAGLLRVAHNGTLFLDEIDALPPRGQVTLLRFLQDGRFRPLGASFEETVDVRLIVASNRSLEALAEQGGFRRDLLFRLCVLSLVMPPLRERTGDPVLLANYFLEQFAKRYCDTERRLESATLTWLNAYRWPGNVRELENLVHRGFLMSEGPDVHVDPPRSLTSKPAGDESTWPTVLACMPYAAARLQALISFDRRYLTDLLRRTSGNVTQAARLAGKERRTFGRLLKKHHLVGAQFRA